MKPTHTQFQKAAAILGISTNELKKAFHGIAAPEPAVKDHCPEKLKPGGCQLHNLHCGYPECNQPPAKRRRGPEQQDKGEKR